MISISRQRSVLTKRSAGFVPSRKNNATNLFVCDLFTRWTSSRECMNFCSLWMMANCEDGSVLFFHVYLENMLFLCLPQLSNFRKPWQRHTIPSTLFAKTCANISTCYPSDKYYGPCLNWILLNIEALCLKRFDPFLKSSIASQHTIVWTISSFDIIAINLFFYFHISSHYHYSISLKNEQENGFVLF